MAKRLVDKFGLATLDILEEEPHRLAEMWKRSDPSSQRPSRPPSNPRRKCGDVMVFLQGHGVSLRTWRGSTRNTPPRPWIWSGPTPIVLPADVYGIGFKIADQIAANLGIVTDSPARIRAGLNYILHLASEEGHVYLPREES